MPRTSRRPDHAHFRIFRFLFTTVVAALLLLSLHGSSIAGTVPSYRSPSPDDVTPRETALRSSLGTFVIPRGATPVVSLQAACRSELTLYCSPGSMNSSGGGSAASTSPLRCLVEHFYRARAKRAAEVTTAAFSNVCESWLAARDTCLSFVHAKGPELCGAAASEPRECLRIIPAAVMPPACVTSDYYEGVRLVGKLRQQQAADVRLRRLYDQ